jgi:hypothetical protein
LFIIITNFNKKLCKRLSNRLGAAVIRYNIFSEILDKSFLILEDSLSNWSLKLFIWESKFSSPLFFSITVLPGPLSLEPIELMAVAALVAVAAVVVDFFAVFFLFFFLHFH